MRGGRVVELGLLAGLLGAGLLLGGLPARACYTTTAAESRAKNLIVNHRGNKLLCCGR